MPKDQNPESDFRSLSAQTEPDALESARAPARLKSQIYSKLIERMEKSGPLLDLPTTRATDRLCVFEGAAAAVPWGKKASRFNFCSVCHARVLAERFEKAPIYWHSCPYAGFQNR